MYILRQGSRPAQAQALRSRTGWRSSQRHFSLALLSHRCLSFFPRSISDWASAFNCQALPIGQVLLPLRRAMVEFSRVNEISETQEANKAMSTDLAHARHSLDHVRTDMAISSHWYLSARSSNSPTSWSLRPPDLRCVLHTELPEMGLAFPGHSSFALARNSDARRFPILRQNPWLH